ncbi:SDR family oxidoreductase [Paraburkholderia sediminicola]|nr:SDR family oxidoreductase [Paraburkholderia sediminicola]
MALRLQGKVCLITGSGGSIGRAAALTFAAEGAHVVGVDVSDSGAATQAAVRDAGHKMSALHPCDLTKPEECQRMVDFALERHGRIDVLFNNAGRVQFAWLDDAPPTDFWYQTIDAELNTVFLATRATWPALINSHGTIVNTASAVAWIAYEVLGSVAHAAAKGGILAMTRQLAMEGRKHGIRANSVSPGWTLSPTSTKLAENAEWQQPMLKKIMRASPGRAQEIANVALFLASDESSFVNGADVLADGGTTAW